MTTQSTTPDDGPITRWRAADAAEQARIAALPSRVLPAGSDSSNQPLDIPGAPIPPDAGRQAHDPRAIVYNEHTHRYRAYHDDHIIGDFPNFLSADGACDDYARDLFERALTDEVPTVHARPAEPAADLLYVCACETPADAAWYADQARVARAQYDAHDNVDHYQSTVCNDQWRYDPATTAALPSLSDTPGHEALVGAPTAPADPLVAALAADPNAALPLLTRASEFDLPLPADAWHCGVCHQIFWTAPGAAPLACPRCEHQALNPPLPLGAAVCSCCGGPHTLAHCEELAQEWRDQAQAEIRAGAAVGAHITRDLSDFLREYARLTEEQRAGVVASYCAWQRAECRPAVVAKRWARMVEELD